MTPDELRSLAQEATPGPWQAKPLTPRSVGELVVRREDDEGPWQGYDGEWTNPADARLIALAPQLALLCAEMGEALDTLAREGREIHNPEYPSTLKSYRAAVSALASLEALEKP